MARRSERTQQTKCPQNSDVSAGIEKPTNQKKQLIKLEWQNVVFNQPKDRFHNSACEQVV